MAAAARWPRPWAAALPLAAWVACAAAGEAGGAAEHREGAPPHVPAACVALFIVSGVVVFAALGKAVLARGRMAVVLCCAMAAGMYVAGLASWGLTYVEVVTKVQAQAENLLIEVANVGEMRVTTDFINGVYMVNMLVNAVRMDTFELKNVYPSSHLDIAMIVHALRTRDHHDVYFGYPGNGDNTAVGGPAFIGFSATEFLNPPLYELWIQIDYGGSFPTWLTCDAYDRGNLTVVTNRPAPVGRMTEECSTYACGLSPNMDFKCQMTCAGRRALVDGVEVVFPHNSSKFCAHYPGDQRLLMAFRVEFDPHEYSGFRSLSTAAGPYHAIPNAKPKLYNAMLRPWWHKERVPTFSEPYHFINDDIGLTLSLGAYDEDDVFAGVASVDYSLADFHTYLKVLTEQLGDGSQAFLTTRSEVLIGSSMTKAQLQADTHVPLALGLMLRVLNITNPKSSVRGTYETICTRLGDGNATRGYHKLFVHASLVYDSDYMYRSVPIIIPDVAAAEAAAAGAEDLAGQYALVITLPLAEVLDEIDDASVLSLVLTMVISLVCSALVFMMVVHNLMPLRTLERGMGQAAQMKLEAVGDVLMTSRVSEVAAMQTSFTLLVHRLREYREYLPQSLQIMDAESFEDEFVLSVRDARQGSGQWLESTAVTPATLESGRHTHPPSTCSSDTHVCRDVVGSPRQSASVLAGEVCTVVHGNPLTRSQSGAVARGTTPPYSPWGSRKDPPSDYPYAATAGAALAASSASRNRSRGAWDEDSSSCGSSPRAATTDVFSMAVTLRHVSVLTLKVPTLLDDMTTSPIIAAQLHAALLGRVLSCARNAKGVVDSFAGDTMTVVFNAHVQTGTHQARALSTAVRIIREHDASLGAHIGVSMGKVHVGNMGCQGMKKFNMVGYTVQRASSYATLATTWAISVVVGECVLRDVRSMFESRGLHAVSFGSRTMMLSALMGEVGLENKEWMYQMEEATRSPYRVLDEILQQLFDESVEAAAATLAAAHNRAGMPHKPRPMLQRLEGADSVGVYLDRLASWIAFLRQRGVARVQPLPLDTPSADVGARDYLLGRADHLGDDVGSLRVDPIDLKDVQESDSPTTEDFVHAYCVSAEAPVSPTSDGMIGF